MTNNKQTTVNSGEAVDKDNLDRIFFPMYYMGCIHYRFNFIFGLEFILYSMLRLGIAGCSSSFVSTVPREKWHFLLTDFAFGGHLFTFVMFVAGIWLFCIAPDKMFSRSIYCYADLKKGIIKKVTQRLTDGELKTEVYRLRDVERLSIRTADCNEGSTKSPCYVTIFNIYMSMRTPQKTFLLYTDKCMKDDSDAYDNIKTTALNCAQTLQCPSVFSESFLPSFTTEPLENDLFLILPLISIILIFI